MWCLSTDYAVCIHTTPTTAWSDDIQLHVVNSKRESPLINSLESRPEHTQMIPLTPDAIHTIWKRMQPFDFDTSHGAFTSMNVRDKNLKARLLESCKIEVKAMGYGDHPLIKEEGATIPEKLELF